MTEEIAQELELYEVTSFLLCFKKVGAILTLALLFSIVATVQAFLKQEKYYFSLK